MEWPDWDEEQLAEFWAQWRRALSWGRDWQAAERRSAELLGLLPEQPEALAGEPEEGPSLADWRLLLGAGRAAELALPGGGRTGRKQPLPADGLKRPVRSRAALLSGRGAAFAESGGRQGGTLIGRAAAEPLAAADLPEEEAALRVLRRRRLEESGRRLEKAGAEEAGAEMSPAGINPAERQMPLRVNLAGGLRADSRKEELTAGEAVLAELRLAEVEEAAAGPEPLAAGLAGETGEPDLSAEASLGVGPEPADWIGPEEWRAPEDLDWAAVSGPEPGPLPLLQNELVRRPPENESAAAEPGGGGQAADMDALAEAVAEIICAEIEAQLGSSAFMD